MSGKWNYDQKTEGVAVEVKSIWWCYVGLQCSHVMKVKYTVRGKDYFKRVWIRLGELTPVEGNTFIVLYCSDKPSKAKVKNKPLREKV